MKNFGLNLRPMPPMKRDRRMRLVMVGNSTVSESLHSSCNLAAYLSISCMSRHLVHAQFPSCYDTIFLP